MGRLNGLPENDCGFCYICVATHDESELAVYNNNLVTGITEWLVDQALMESDIVEMFEGVCSRLYGIGIPIARARLTWPTLHPLFQAETVLWKRDHETEFEQFNHQENVSDAWLHSPMKYMIDQKIEVLRRNLDGPNKMVDFPILEEMVGQGMTDYLVISTRLSAQPNETGKPSGGIVVTWSPDRAGGFSEADIAALQRIQRRFAVACKTIIQARIASNITQTYLGEKAGERVLRGEIKRGDGSNINAVVWYSDLRGSTALADTMPSEDFLQMLNVYFECTAGPAIEAGGEVLDFIGDAVLAIFPYETEDDLHKAANAATRAIRQSMEKTREANKLRVEEGLQPIDFGIGLNVGTVMFGNIGVPQRLSFSVIGPTVNEVARIETMTKATEASTLVTPQIAKFNPDIWHSTGHHRLDGVAQKIELFALKEDQPALPVDVATQAATLGETVGQKH